MTKPNKHDRNPKTVARSLRLAAVDDPVAADKCRVDLFNALDKAFRTAEAYRKLIKTSARPVEGPKLVQKSYNVQLWLENCKNAIGSETASILNGLETRKNATLRGFGQGYIQSPADP